MQGLLTNAVRQFLQRSDAGPEIMSTLEAALILAAAAGAALLVLFLLVRFMKWAWTAG